MVPPRRLPEPPVDPHLPADPLPPPPRAAASEDEHGDRPPRKPRGGLDGLAFASGVMLDPLVVFWPALLAVARDDPAGGAIWMWYAGVAALVTLPLGTAIALVHAAGGATWQRGQRWVLYATFFASMTAALAAVGLLGGPPRLQRALLALCFWMPLHGCINEAYTKLSTHTAVLAGVVTFFWLEGDLAGPPLAAAAAAVPLLAWARVRLRHHTLLQVCLGVAVGSAAIALAIRVSAWMPALYSQLAAVLILALPLAWVSAAVRRRRRRHRRSQLQMRARTG